MKAFVQKIRIGCHFILHVTILLKDFEVTAKKYSKKNSASSDNI